MTQAPDDGNSEPLLKVAIFGATGVAGRGVAEACLADPRVGEVRVVVRRALGVESPKLREFRCEDFATLVGCEEALDDIDLVFYCLGKAVSQVSGEAAYRLLTFDYAMAAGRATVAASPKAIFHFLSGQGTNAKSRMMWARVKGETEQALAKLPLGRLMFWRPGLIMAEETPADAPAHYRVMYPVMRALYFIRRLAVTSRALGQAMLQASIEQGDGGSGAATSENPMIFENRDIRAAADRYLESGGVAAS